MIGNLILDFKFDSQKAILNFLDQPKTKK